MPPSANATPPGSADSPATPTCFAAAASPSLYGITVDRLGHDAVTSARNARLIAICQHVRSLDTGGRVIEALASGIPTIANALTTHALPPAKYLDTNIRFTALLRRPAASARTAPTLNPTELRIYDALVTGPHTVADLETALALTRPNIRKALRSLRDHGLVHQDGGKGRHTTYRHTNE